MFAQYTDGIQPMDPAFGFLWIIPFYHPVSMEEMPAQFKRIKESPSFSFLGLPVACLLSHSIPRLSRIVFHLANGHHIKKKTTA